MDQIQTSEKPPASADEVVVEPMLKSTKVEDLLTSDDSGPAAAVLTPEPANVESENALKGKRTTDYAIHMHQLRT